MTLLEDLIAEAQGTGPVSSVLRKLLVIAKRTGSSDSLLRWVNLETQGYPEGTKLPTYRGPFDLNLLAHFVGTGVAERNVRLSRFGFPEKMHQGPMFVTQFPQSVTVIEHFAEQDSLNLAWSAEYVEAYNRLVRSKEIRPPRPGMVLVSVKCPTSPHIFVGILAQIRNRALDLALDLEAVAPNAGATGVSESTKNEIRQIVNNYNYFYNADFSGSNNAIGSSDFEQDQVQ